MGNKHRSFEHIHDATMHTLNNTEHKSKHYGDEYQCTEKEDVCTSSNDVEAQCFGS